MSKKFPCVSDNALRILEKRNYLWQKEDGARETVDEMFSRVAKVAASPEKDKNNWESKYFEIMRDLRLIPNTPTLTNAGRKNGQYSACYVLPLEDSMEGIMDTIKTQALIQKTGGGTGFSFSKIRERGSLIKSTGMYAVGPIPVIKLMNYMMSEFIIQGGTRHGANMAVLPVDHPDIVEFIKFKHKDGACSAFNVSVGITDEFMQAVEAKQNFILRSRSGRSSIVVDANEIFNLICKFAWETGDPGIIFIDRANRDNPTPHLGDYESTNPCSEQFLLPNESCTLAHHNLTRYYIENPVCNGSWQNHFDWNQFKADIAVGIRFLDNIIDINYYTTRDIEHMHKELNRKVGLGVMGFADLLMMFGMSYASPDGRRVAREISSFFRKNADLASSELAMERGSFGSFKGSKVEADGWTSMRNACRTTIAPTGTTSIIAGCSSGIEPIFALVMERKQAGMTLNEINPLFEKYLQSSGEQTALNILGWHTEHGTVTNCPYIPEQLRSVFVQAHDISVDDHIKMQATWQENIDSAISKTINMSHNATVADVASAYNTAWHLGCKGITIYRDHSRNNQVLSLKTVEMNTIKDQRQIALQKDIAVFDILTQSLKELCPECSTSMEMIEGCSTCKNCGFALCSM